MNGNIQKIINDSKLISSDKIGQEVLVWVISNVENFIDNQNKIFKLDLIVDDVKEMQETQKLQDLYRAIPDKADVLEENILEQSEKCRRNLDEITNNAFKYIQTCDILLNQLFERMSFYYGRIIKSQENKAKAFKIDEELKELFNQKENALTEQHKKDIQNKIVAKIKEGEDLIKFIEVEGSVNITKFEYDAFEVGVQIKDANNEEGEERKILKDYVIPEGFTIWLEINFKNKQRPTSMF
jgi:hypothetical protein